MKRDFWDLVQSFINGLEDECTRMFKAGRLAVFAEQDPIAKVSAYSWFADAKPIARGVAGISIRNEVRKLIEYYRFADELLTDDCSVGEGLAD